MNTQEKKQEKVRETLRRYIADDGLKPEYDGMTAWELAGIILREVDKVNEEEEFKLEQKLADLTQEMDEDTREWAELHGAYQDSEGNWIV